MCQRPSAADNVCMHFHTSCISFGLIVSPDCFVIHMFNSRVNPDMKIADWGNGQYTLVSKRFVNIPEPGSSERDFVCSAFR